MINRMGPVFPVRTQADTGADLAAIARAYTIAREVLEIRSLWSEIEALDNRIAASVQYAAIEQTTRILRHLSYWLLTNQRADLDIERAVRRLRPGTAELMRQLASMPRQRRASAVRRAPRETRRRARSRVACDTHRIARCAARGARRSRGVEGDTAAGGGRGPRLLRPRASASVLPGSSSKSSR